MGGVDRQFVLNLMKQRSGIEEEIKRHQETLKRENVGLQEPLVDNEGYPRNDIDVPAVRHARHGIICLQNDHKAIMKEIEKALHTLHAQEKEKNGSNVATVDNKHVKSVSDIGQEKPFAKVTEVTRNSPAEEAGLEVEDLITSFGSVTPQNFVSIQNIGAIVQHSVGKTVSITVLRGHTIVHLALVPKQHGGRGLLGCNIVPV